MTGGEGSKSALLGAAAPCHPEPAARLADIMTVAFPQKFLQGLGPTAYDALSNNLMNTPG